MRGKGRRRAVVAGLDGLPGETFDHLSLLVRRLVAGGVDVEVVVVGEGEMLRRLREIVPVTVVDGFRRRGLAGIAGLIGLRRLAGVLKVLRLRRWVRRRSDIPWVIHHPVAASVLRVGRGKASYQVACLPTVGLSTADIVPADLATLRSADRWLARTPEQVVELRAEGLADVVEVGSLRELPPRPVLGSAGRSVLLVPSAPGWDLPNHTIEVARFVAARHPHLRIVWAVDGADDRWMAEYDLRCSGLSSVEVVDRADVDATSALVVVRTGYGPGSLDLLRWAAELGVPLLGFDLPPPWDGAAVVESVGPLDVDALLDRLSVLVGPDAALRTEQRCRDRWETWRGGATRLDEVAEHIRPVQRRPPHVPRGGVAPG